MRYLFLLLVVLSACSQAPKKNKRKSDVKNAPTQEIPITVNINDGQSLEWKCSVSEDKKDCE